MLDKLDIDILNSLSQSELSALKYIDAHQQQVISMSIQELAKEMYISTATILRLCKKMKLSGFSELKYTLKNQISSQITDSGVVPDEKKTLEECYNVIENTCRLIDEIQMETVISYLLGDYKIHLYAGGLSAPVLEYMQRFLLSTGRPCFFYSTAPMGYRAAAKMTEKDILFISSTSGATPSVLRIAQIAKSNGATIIAISNLDNNPLSQIADINFFTFIQNRDYYGTDVKSRASSFYIIDAILECYLYRLNITTPISLEGGFSDDT